MLGKKLMVSDHLYTYIVEREIVSHIILQNNILEEYTNFQSKLILGRSAFLPP